MLVDKKILIYFVVKLEKIVKPSVKHGEGSF